MRILLLVLITGLLAACGGKPQAWTSQQVVDALKAAGLEAESTRTMTEEDYGLSPIQADEGTRFLIPSLCEDCGGRIMTDSDPKELEVLEKYYIKGGEVSPDLKSWLYRKDNILLQINGDLPEDQAKKYESALQSLK